MQYKKIKLTQGKYALVDKEDFEFLSQWKWHLSAQGYARRSIYFGMEGGKPKVSAIGIHREILKPEKGLEVDHINGNKLDNRKHNLRIVTRSQNNMNHGLRKKKHSKYKGVHFCHYTRKWRARIILNYRSIELGRFSTEKEAGEAYKLAAKRHFGEYARAL